MEAARNACGQSDESRFYAKLIVDRYELAMREHGFEYQPAAPLPPIVASDDFEEDAAQPQPARASDFATVFARFYRALR